MKKFCLILTGLLLILLLMSLAIVMFDTTIPLAGKVALIRVEGPILDADSVVEEIKEHSQNASVKAIVLRIDSPGGAVVPSQEIYEEIKNAAVKKKVIASMGSMAASGGYYIASPASRIVANPGTITGSIGVILEIPNVEGLMNKIGVTSQVIKSGKHKDIGSAFRGIKEEEKEILQGVMDNVHAQFIEAVSVGRKMDIENVRKISDGRIFTGEQALEQGLVDELGTLEDAILLAAEMVGIKGKPVVVKKEDRFSLFKMLENKLPGNMMDLFPQVKLKYIYSP
ncbi:MAG: signal peptide peptidase SppA [Nitrospiraceae bacterium]|nr:MAG: signal peptide peptidase SppA [Nitrospiraceae bacterium]